MPVFCLCRRFTSPGNDGTKRAGLVAVRVPVCPGNEGQEHAGGGVGWGGARRRWSEKNEDLRARVRVTRKCTRYHSLGISLGLVVAGLVVATVLWNISLDAETFRTQLLPRIFHTGSVGNNQFFAGRKSQAQRGTTLFFCRKRTSRPRACTCRSTPMA